MIEMNEADNLSQEIATTQITRVARRAAKILKIAAGVIAVGAIVNGWINATFDQNEVYGNPHINFPLTWKVQQFLYTALGNLAWAALILAAGFAIEIVGLRASRQAAPVSAPASSVPPAPSAPAHFASRPAQTPTSAPSPAATTAPPPMKIANDEDIWRR